MPATNETSKTDASVAAPTYDGYTLVSGQTMPTTKAGVTSYQLQYAANQYHVSVTYTGLPTNSLPTPNMATGTTGESYQINSPEIAGYTLIKQRLWGLMVQQLLLTVPLPLNMWLIQRFTRFSPLMQAVIQLLPWHQLNITVKRAMQSIIQPTRVIPL
ncbi:MucBP domain-containing protein [Secundilactobacillus silagei]|uniref:MucBP domain-containing protein n=1 Tax=Secundilactobacillus silagei TaxID=1293415 RepID=UPI0020926E3C|nr:MucBP domain-containing protein [Secundilactobacillus silagei]